MMIITAEYLNICTSDNLALSILDINGSTMPTKDVDRRANRVDPGGAV